MAGSLNQVQLIGHVGKDPEVRSTQSGDKIANFSMATSESWTDRASGERKERTEWHRIVVWNEHLVKVVEQWVKKGTLLFVQGKLNTRKWTDQAGVERYTTEISLDRFGGTLTMLGGKPDGQGSSSSSGSSAGGGSSSGGSAWESGGRGGGQTHRGATSRDSGRFGGGNDLDDEIPF